MVDIKPEASEIKVQTSQEVKSMGLMTDLKPKSIEAMIQACSISSTCFTQTAFLALDSGT
jgi:hypothetical protein